VNFQVLISLNKTGPLLDGTCSLSDTESESGEEQLCALNEVINELNVKNFFKVNN
jgi:hypothetical protein